MSFTYKRCAVPHCGKTTICEPEKLYFRVPDSSKLRNEWLKLARRDPSKVSSKSTMYFCEDHFDPPNDMENYLQHKLMGPVKRVKLRPNCLPTKFQCQEKVMPLESSTHLETIAPKSGIPVVETCIPTSAVPMDTVSDRDKSIRAYPPDTTDKSIQKFPKNESSVHIQTPCKTLDHATSPTKMHYNTTGTMPIIGNDDEKPSTSGCTIQKQIKEENSETSSVTSSISESESMAGTSMSESTEKLLDLEHRSVIKFLTKEGKEPKEIFERMQTIYGPSAPSEYKVKFWSKQFKWGRESIEDDPHTGRPVTATTPENCKNVEEFILANKRVTVPRIAEEMDISAGTVWIMMHENLLTSAQDGFHDF